MARLQIPPIQAYLKRLTTNLNLLMITIAILVTLWISLIIISVYFFGMANNWAGLAMDHWVLVGIGLLTFFIIITLLLNLLPILIARQKISRKKRKPIFYQGKRVHEYTFPPQSQGGIFSRTYISIDDNNIVNFRYQMISPDQLWPKKTIKQ
jgi:hypothetical protein